MCCKSSKHGGLLKQVSSIMQFKDEERDCNYQIHSKEVSHKVINYIGDSLKLCHETERHIILSQGKKKSHITIRSSWPDSTQKRSLWGLRYITNQKDSDGTSRRCRTCNTLLFIFKRTEALYFCATERN